jgi:ribulose-5-phosphate 4-epimerase/fuculose-1-phosphate aldolase
MGDMNVAVMENHGLLVAGPTAADAFLMLYNIENACKVQVDVMASGQEMIMPSEEALARTIEVGNDPEFVAADENWQAIRRILDAKDPSYKT